MAKPPSPRTFTEALRAMRPEALGRLLSARVDLCYPTPADFGELASRAATTTSVQRGLDRLNAWQRLVCESLAACADPSRASEVAALMGVPVKHVRSTLTDLLDLGLAWGSLDSLHLVRNVRTAFGAYPCGLAKESSKPLQPAQVKTLVGDLDEPARTVLDRLAWGPPTGSVRHADRPVTPATAQSPIEVLLSSGLLRPLDSDTVVLPREVALWLRRPRTVTRLDIGPEPPMVTGRTRAPKLVDRAAAGAALGLLHDADQMLADLTERPFRTLRTGGLAARDVAALARRLDLGVPQTTFVLECCGAADLVNTRGDRLLPTPTQDRWAALDAAERWHRVVRAWLDEGRWFARSGRDGGHALGPEAAMRGAADLRGAVLDVIIGTDPGTVLDPAQVRDAVAWLRPRWTENPQLPLADAVADVLIEAGWLGLTALGAHTALTAAARSDQEDVVLPSHVTDHFPAAVEHLVVQSDLTAVAPGPLTKPVADELRLLAEQESRGGGGVFRFSPTSLRRAFDAGWSQSEVEEWLHRHSTTGVPQPLAYLVADVARRHGSIRVGSAHAYIRTEDETHAAAILAHPAAAVLQVRKLAPGVLVSAADPDEVVAVLREIGLTPAAEDSGGRVLAVPQTLRAPNVHRPAETSPADPRRTAAAIVATEAEYRRLAGATDETLVTLTEAVRERVAVSIAFVGGDGRRELRTGMPTTLGSGQVRLALADGGGLTVPLARISSVRPLLDSG